MKSAEIRQKFLTFFESKEHQIVESAPLVLKNDPSLMFTNAGMNQFKDYFLGNKNAENKRITDTQKCLRVSGKHNDLEEVGMDTYHHTMFEMLGNWSFGDYFKKEAIDWAWELLTEVFQLNKEDLYITIFEGDEADGVAEDLEALDLWTVHVPKERIIKCDKKDNFWEMGDTGPCGPCSEIHVDIRSAAEKSKIPGKDLVNMDHPQVIEIWNLVFIQYNRKANGSLEELPDKHIDTGMGFERLSMVCQGKQSNYDTDVFQPMIQFIANKAGVVYGKDEKVDIALRVISDHIRAITFAVADGQLPSNTGAGYVIRRILRRAVRYGYTFLNFQSPFLNDLVALLADQFKDVFPEVVSQSDFIKKVIEEEESSFLRTLTIGISRLESILDGLPEGKVVDGKTVFELYDTYGFPVDLTALIARESGYSIDEAGFKQEMEVQKARSRNAAETSTGDWIEVNPAQKVVFLGYDDLVSTSKILRYREIDEKKKKIYQVVLNKTPFYPEGGGQVGDQGYIEAEGKKYSVLTTKKENDLIIHILNELPTSFKVDFSCVVNVSKRKLIENNHTATHLLQAALKQVLGDHIAQKGSLVNEKILRFDFSHFSKLTDEEILKVEEIVNSKVREGIALDEKRSIPIQEALESGATALFGEKYGDEVRMITFDKHYSIELCGGTHVANTSLIGNFKIISEGSVAAGVRRIEAVTSVEADLFLNKKLQTLEEINELLKQPKDLTKAVDALLKDRVLLERKIETFRRDQQKSLVNELSAKVVAKGNVNYIALKIEAESADVVKNVAFDLRNKINNLLLVLPTDIEGKPSVTIMISDELVKTNNWNAGNSVRELGKLIKGGGGGQPFFATAGGNDINGLDKVLEEAEKLFF